MKIASPAANVINIRTLAHATTVVNERLRHHNLSAKEILFSRDQASKENLALKDADIASTIPKHRETKNPTTAHSQASVKKPAPVAGAKVGQLVFLKSEGSKSKSR